MKITNEFTIWCDCCEVWYQTSAKTKSIAIKEFKQLGWKEKSGKTVCPDCDKKKIDNK